jgi:hypothetical protein
MAPTINSAASAYEPCNDLWIVTTYYNPAGFRSRRENYARFAWPIVEAGIPLVTVECAFGGEPFELPPSPYLIQVRGQDTMWLKERLISLAIAQLPPHVSKVAWVDADILFANVNWAQQTADLLDRFSVVQPFVSIRRLSRDARSYSGVGRYGFAYQLQRRPQSGVLSGNGHGQPGIAWAARRELIARVGLYDAAILGGGDELFSHALVGGWASSCVRIITTQSPAKAARLIERVRQRLLRMPWPRPLARWYANYVCAHMPPVEEEVGFYTHYRKWAQALYSDVRGQVGHAPGVALHLWHGDQVNRGYGSRNDILRRHAFDPATDLRLSDSGLWAWASDKPSLHQEVKNYFFRRREDD